MESEIGVPIAPSRRPTLPASKQDIAPVLRGQGLTKGRRAEAIARAARPEEAVALALRLAVRPGA